MIVTQELYPISVPAIGAFPVDTIDVKKNVDCHMPSLLLFFW
jgi:hypothetical protein